ncbi:hypothetical protein FOXYSP1_20189 [Fusarium oxysporum f. sp. phaseoli]
MVSKSRRHMPTLNRFAPIHEEVGVERMEMIQACAVPPR